MSSLVLTLIMVKCHRTKYNVTILNDKTNFLTAKFSLTCPWLWIIMIGQMFLLWLLLDWFNVSIELNLYLGWQCIEMLRITLPIHTMHILNSTFHNLHCILCAKHTSTHFTLKALKLCYRQMCIAPGLIKGKYFATFVPSLACNIYAVYKLALTSLEYRHWAGICSTAVLCRILYY